MCGIARYVGARSAAELIVGGLKRLEYRGYDSAGIAVVAGSGLAIRRAVGRIGNLETLLRDQPVTGSVGLGHTRWATHGRACEVSAHPHADCTDSVVVVHNGILENYLFLKERLTAQGHRFRSETDTEVIAHLIESHLSAGLELPDATRAAVREVRGAYAVAVLAARTPDQLVVAKQGAGAVVIGLGDGETHLGSDIPTLLPHARDVIILEDGGLAIVTAKGARITTSDGESVDRKATSHGTRRWPRRADTGTSC
jgi:glucosamine--fructose-6-phosphate aminotransferase (isomerizing)